MSFILGQYLVLIFFWTCYRYLLLVYSHYCLPFRYSLFINCLGFIVSIPFYFTLITSGKIFLGTLLRPIFRVCKTGVSRDFSDLRRLAAICYKRTGYHMHAPTSYTIS